MFLKTSHSIVWYDILCFPMLWYDMGNMVCYDISLLCYAKFHVVKDKHKATVCPIFETLTFIMSFKQ